MYNWWKDKQVYVVLHFKVYDCLFCFLSDLYFYDNYIVFNNFVFVSVHHWNCFLLLMLYLNVHVHALFRFERVVTDGAVNLVWKATFVLTNSKMRDKKLGRRILRTAQITSEVLFGDRSVLIVNACTLLHLKKYLYFIIDWFIITLFCCKNIVIYWTLFCFCFVSYLLLTCLILFDFEANILKHVEHLRSSFTFLSTA